MRIAALDVGGTAVKYGIVDEHGGVERHFETKTQAQKGAAALMELLSSLLRTLSPFDAIAVSTAGQVDPREGRILFANQNLPGYTGMPVRRLLEDEFSVPVTVENDVNCAAMGEYFFGAAKGVPDFLCLTYGTGIGGAIVCGGKLFHGSSYSAGEFGHMTTHAGGRKCACGQSGCYEQYASTGALVRQVRRKTGKLMDGREIFALRAAGDPILCDAVDGWLREILVGIGSLVHILNPRCILLGGGVMNEDYAIRFIRAHIRDYLMPSYHSLEICRPALGNLAGMVGAAALSRRA